MGEPGGLSTPTGPLGASTCHNLTLELLEEAVEETLADMKRRAEVGLLTAAETLCCGIVLGLHEAEKRGSDGLLDWAPEFPAEMACQAVSTLIRACPADERTAMRDRLLEALEERVDDWIGMIEGAANGALGPR